MSCRCRKPEDKLTSLLASVAQAVTHFALIANERRVNDVPTVGNLIASAFPSIDADYPLT